MFRAIVTTALGLSLLFLITACGMASSYVHSGQKLKALPETARVTVVEKGAPAFAVETIGYITISGAGLEEMKTEAQTQARLKGGNVVILLDLIKGAKLSDGSLATRTFEIARKVDGSATGTK